MKKIKVISFREFMSAKKGTYIRSSALTLVPAAAITHVSIDGLWRMSPVVLNGYLVLIIAGIVLIGAAILERYFITDGLVEIANSIAAIFMSVLPFVFIAIMIAFVYMSPLL
ncbi:MAG: hypothetical protein ACK4HV_00280 [Parachlamydiaceae bacterium]